MIVYPKMDLKDTIDYNGNMADIVGVVQETHAIPNVTITLWYYLT